MSQGAATALASGSPAQHWLPFELPAGSRAEPRVHRIRPTSKGAGLAAEVVSDAHAARLCHRTDRRFRRRSQCRRQQVPLQPTRFFRTVEQRHVRAERTHEAPQQSRIIVPAVSQIFCVASTTYVQYPNPCASQSQGAIRRRRHRSVRHRLARARHPRDRSTCKPRGLGPRPNELSVERCETWISSPLYTSRGFPAPHGQSAVMHAKPHDGPLRAPRMCHLSTQIMGLITQACSG